MGDKFFRLGFSRLFLGLPFYGSKPVYNRFGYILKNSRSISACYCTSSRGELGSNLPGAENVIANNFEIKISEKRRIAADAFYKNKPICSSCGSSIHKSNPSMPGYLDSKVLSKYIDTNSDVKDWVDSLICKRCFDLKNRNIIPTLSTNPNYARELLSSRIPNSKGLIIYLVDLMNIYGSTLPSIEQLIGSKKRVIIVGTKLDLLPMEENGKFNKQIKSTENYLRSRCIADGLNENLIRDVCLISAKTGGGIDRLVSLINEHRGEYMPVYFVGCTNTGKSTLFNTIQNLFSTHKDDLSLPSQALTHFYPGSTIGFVRHRLTFSRIERLRWRLKKPPGTNNQELLTGAELLDESFIKETFGEKDGLKIVNKMTKDEPMSAQNSIIPQSREMDSNLRYQLIDDTSRRSDSNWMYDTPGIIRLDQVTKFLTAKELKLLQQTDWIVPRTAVLSPGLVLCLGGLAHIHYNDIKRQNPETFIDEEVPKANQSVFLTVVCPRNLPIHITTVKKMDSLMERHQKDLILEIPFDYDNRGFDMPSMESKQYEIEGKGWAISGSDIAIHGIGWVGVTAGNGSKLNINVFTPGGIGQDVYSPSFMPYAVKNRGRRGVKDLGNTNTALYQGTRKNNPQLLADKFNMSFTEEWTNLANERLVLQKKLSKMQRSKYLLQSGINPGSKKFANIHNERLTTK